MKHYIRNLIILSLGLIIVSFLIILFKARTYTVVFNFYDAKDQTLEIENVTGEIEVLDRVEKDDKLYLTVKGKKPGKVNIYLNKEDISSFAQLYIHKTMIITDNSYFGDCNYAEVIPISILIILFYLMAILIKKYKDGIKDNLYQYKNIAYLGLIIFLSFFIVRTFLSIFTYQGLFNTVNDIIGSMSFISILLFPIATITFIFVTISNIHLIIKEGKSLRNLLGLFLGIFLCISTLLPEFIYRILMKVQVINIYNLNSVGPYLYDFLETLVYLSIAYLECVLLGTIIIAIKSVHRKLKYDKDYMIILGCGINKDGTLPPLLKGRADAAIKFRNEQLKETKKDLVFIPSGGQGSDEKKSEGQAISNYLKEQGIPSKNIIIEDKSTNTYENIRNSYKLIKKKDAKIAYSTTNYHVLRAGIIATGQGLKLEGIGSKTKAYFWINAFIREFIGTLYSEKKKHALVILSIIIVIIIMISITYVSYNI